MTKKHEKYEFAIESLGLTKEEQEYIDKLQKEEFFKKGTVFLAEGQLMRNSYYVIKGCVRKYLLKDGEEKTAEFFLENDSITTGPSGLHNNKATYSLECLEDTTLKVISSVQEEILYNKFPRFQAMCRVSTEKRLEEYQEKFAKFIASSPEERYLDLLENRPELLNRVPQYQLASFLGVKPESLSRIRKRLMT